MNSSSSKSRARLARDIAIAAFLVVGSAVLVWLTPGVISRDASYRAFGVLLGLFVMFYANEGPKALPPLDRVRNPVAEQARRRFTGWVITLGGLAYVLTWLIAPVSYAPPISMTLLALSVAAPLWRCMVARRRASTTSTSGAV
jgi:hypothetical protein